jgi:hypothetical protein
LGLAGIGEKYIIFLFQLAAMKKWLLTTLLVVMLAFQVFASCGLIKNASAQTNPAFTLVLT